jgi:hypothetical protein
MISATVHGKPVKLSDNDFISSGGEGKVFAKGDVAFKIYTDQSKVIEPKKFRELSVLDDDNIIRPLDMVYVGGVPMGYTMRYLKDTIALCQAFTKSFKVRNNMTPDQVLNLVLKLRRNVSFCHSKGVLIVDLNEFNFLMDKKLVNLFNIDVDSYQTPNFPATAIMESVRDRHAKKFDPGTDWFSFGIVSFQLFVGIHPYKGTHPSVKGLEDRMNGNLSVFRKGVSIPACCEKLSVIPDVFSQWFQAVFDRGERVPPPSSATAQAQVARVEVVKAAGQFRITKIRSYADPIRRMWADPTSGEYVVLAGNKMYWGALGAMVLDGAVPFVSSSPLAAWTDGNLVVFDPATKQIKPTEIAAESVHSDGHYLLVKNGSRLTWVDVGPNLSAFPRKTFGVMEKATKIFDNLVIQDMLGACHVSLHSGGNMYQHRIKELDGHDILNAKTTGGYTVIVSRRNGKTFRLTCKLSDEVNVWKMEETDNVDVNCASKDGVSFVTYDGDSLELSGFHGGKWASKEFKGLNLGGSTLVSGPKIMLFDDCSLYAIENKTP